MIMDIYGIDPGPVTGIVLLRLSRNGLPRQLVTAEAMQVTYGLVNRVLDTLYRDCPEDPAIAIERYVVGRRAAQSMAAPDGEITRGLIGVITHRAAAQSLSCHVRSASEVKPWATDTRLAAAGLLALTKGMGHARDAARHALFCAVRCYGLPDPLSRRVA
jgi:hypothetical protein